MKDNKNEKLIFIRLKELLKKSDLKLYKCFKYTDDDIDLTKLLSELNEISSEPSTLRLAVAGQSNVGKSSLIKALTGEELFIDSDVSTEEIREVKYQNDLCLIDMPGTLSGQLVHDQKAKTAIIDSDLMLFVLTNELFNSSNYPYFEKAMADFKKDNQTLIVINQFDRVNLQGRTEEDAIALIREQIAERISPLDVNKFGPIFVSARDYLDSLDESDSEYKQELIRDSRMATLIRAIDEFCLERGPAGRLSRLFQLRLDLINRAVEEAASGDNEQPLLQELLRRKIDCYTEVQQHFNTEKRNLLSSVRHKISELAEPVVQLVEAKSDADEINAAWEETDEKVKSILADTTVQLKDMMESSVESLNRKIQELNETPTALSVDKFLKYKYEGEKDQKKLNGGKESFASKCAKKFDIKGICNKGGDELAKNSGEISKKIVDAVSKFKKFKPYGKIKLGNAAQKWIGRAGKCIGPLMVLFECYMNYRDEEKAEKAEKVRLSFKAEIRKNLSQIASSACSQLELLIHDFDKECFKKDIEKMKEARSAIAQLAQKRSVLIEELLQGENEVRYGLDLIAGSEKKAEQ